MTALWFAHLDAPDRVAVKPHASPVFHAIQYLLGNLDRSYLTTLRARGGLQSYPSPHQGPRRGRLLDRLGRSGRRRPALRRGDPALRRRALRRAAAQPIRRARRRRRARRGQRLGGDRRPGDHGPRQRDAGSSTSTARRSTGSCPASGSTSGARQFAGGRLARGRGEVRPRLQAAFAEPGGEALRALDRRACPTSTTSRCSARRRRRCASSSSTARRARSQDLVRHRSDDGARDAGHRPRRPRPRWRCSPRLRECDAVHATGPACVFAYTSRAGACRSPATRATTRRCSPATRSTSCARRSAWTRAPSGTGSTRRRRPGIWVSARRESAGPRPPARPRLPRRGAREHRAARRQADLDPGGVRPRPGRAVAQRGRRAVPRDHGAGRRDLDQPGRLHQPGRRLRARRARQLERATRCCAGAEAPSGQHIELGISEMNLFLLLGQLGLSWDLSGQPLLPVGTVYDPFVLRGLDAFIYGVYSGARFVVAGTPSGVTLAPEGGAHQSTITPSIGLELPGVTLHRAGVRRGSGLAALRRARPDRRRAATPTSAAVPVDDGAYYFRLTTRPIDQAPFEAARARVGDAVLRRQVLAGAYRLVDASSPPRAARRRSAGAPRRQRRGAAGGAVGRRRACRRGHRGSRRRRDLRSTGCTAPGSARCGRASGRRRHRAIAGRAAHGVRRPGADRHACTTRASHAMAWLGSALGVPCRAARRRRVRPVRHGAPTSTSCTTSTARLDRQRRPGRPHPRLSSAARPRSAADLVGACPGHHGLDLLDRDDVDIAPDRLLQMRCGSGELDGLLGRVPE